MGERNAIELQPVPFEALAAAPGSGSRLPVIAALVAASTVVLALIVSGFGKLLLVAAITLLAAIGLFFLLAFVAGYLRFGQRQPLAEIVTAATDGLDNGVMIASRDGEALYANAAFTALVGREAHGVATLQELFTGEPQASAALFRLTRAAERGEPLTEEFALRSASTGARAGRTLQVSVHPFDADANGAPTGLVVWRIADVTIERQQEAARLAGVEVQLAQFDSAPVGLASVGADGTLLRINGTLARWIGRTSKAVLDQRLTLSDITPGDGAGLVASLLGRAGSHPASLDVELMREDGRVVPVRFFARAVPSGKGLTLAVLNLADESATEFEADAGGARFARFFQSAPFGIAILGPDGRIANANASFCKLVLDGASGVGIAAVEALCRSAETETRSAVEAGLKRVLSGRAGVEPVEITVGARRDHVSRVYMSPFASAGGDREAAILYVVDATEQKALEAKFAQSQKMDVVGKLAGFVAHDFNNMLTAIIGFSDMLLTMHRPKDLAYKDIMNIKSSANRAAGLVSKLLALARQQTLQNEVLQMSEVLTDLAALLKRSIGEKIELKIVPAANLWYVKTDKLQLEQAIINLAVNARDAMAGGGTLTIRLGNVTERDSNKVSHLGFAGGEYVLIEVEDTGHGMSKEVLSKIFEPFFTTKAVGKGTGLGLATVYGIVKQTGGYIYPVSEVGKGTTFSIYLPRHQVEREDELPAPKEKKKEQRAADLTGTGRVLLVEDEDVVRSFAVRALKRQGYKVLEASTGVEALEVMAKNEGKIDLVISDVVMPEMDGPTLLKELRKTNPTLKIIFVSGYPNDAFKASLGEEEFAFLPKPFSLPQLAAKVKEELSR